MKTWQKIILVYLLIGFIYAFYLSIQPNYVLTGINFWIKVFIWPYEISGGFL